MRFIPEIRLPESICGILPGALFFNLFFKMRGPGEFHQQPHQQCRGHREASLVEKSDGNKTKDERVGRAPVPKILVQKVEQDGGNDEQYSFHLDPYLVTQIVSLRPWPKNAGAEIEQDSGENAAHYKTKDVEIANMVSEGR